MAGCLSLLKRELGTGDEMRIVRTFDIKVTYELTLTDEEKVKAPSLKEWNKGMNKHMKEIVDVDEPQVKGSFEMTSKEEIID